MSIGENNSYLKTSAASHYRHQRNPSFASNTLHLYLEIQSTFSACLTFSSIGISHQQSPTSSYLQTPANRCCYRHPRYHSLHCSRQFRHFHIRLPPYTCDLDRQHPWPVRHQGVDIAPSRAVKGCSYGLRSQLHPDVARCI